MSLRKQSQEKIAVAAVVAAVTAAAVVAAVTAAAAVAAVTAAAAAIVAAAAAAVMAAAAETAGNSCCTFTVKKKAPEKIPSGLFLFQIMNCPVQGILPDIDIEKVEIGDVVVFSGKKETAGELWFVYPQETLMNLGVCYAGIDFVEFPQHGSFVERFVGGFGSACPDERICDGDVVSSGSVFRQVAIPVAAPGTKATRLVCRFTGRDGFKSGF